MVRAFYGKIYKIYSWLGETDIIHLAVKYRGK
jgi:hypothetical protein